MVNREEEQEILGYLMFSKENRMELFPLQWLAATKLRAVENKCVYVFDETGAGKTIVAGNCILNCVLENKCRDVNILIVCPMNLTLNWYNKLILHYGLEFKLWGNTKDDRHYLDETGSNLVICSYDVTRLGEKTALDFLTEQNFMWDLVVLDEVHNTKGEMRNEGITRLKAKKCLAATATPVTNEWEELKKIIETTYKIVDSPEEAENVYDTFLKRKKELLYNCSPGFPFTRNFKEIVTYNPEKEPKIKAKERKIIKKTYTVSEKVRNRFWERMGEDRNALRQYQNYSNIWLMLGNELEPGEDKKLEAFKEIIFETVQEKRKSVVFCRRKETVQYLIRALEEMQIRCKGITAEEFQSIDARKRFIQNTNKKATRESEFDVLVTIDTLLNEGYDMISFDTVINYELPFTPAQLEQRFGRVDRLNSEKKTIYMYNFENMSYKNEFDGAYHNILDEKLLQHVLTRVPSKSLFDGTTLIKLVQNTYLRYLVYKLLEEEIKKYPKEEAENIDGEWIRKFPERLEADEEVKVYAHQLVYVIFWIKAQSNKGYYEIISDERREKEKILTNVLQKIPANMEELEKLFADQDLEQKFSKSIVWMEDKGVVSCSLEEIEDDIRSEKSGYARLEKETEDIKKRIQEYVESIRSQIKADTEEEAAAERKKVLCKIWDSLERAEYNYVYCSMVMYNLWRSCFNSMVYEDFISEVNEVIYER